MLFPGVQRVHIVVEGVKIYIDGLDGPAVFVYIVGGVAGPADDGCGRNPSADNGGDMLALFLCHNFLTIRFLLFVTVNFCLTHKNLLLCLIKKFSSENTQKYYTLSGKKMQADMPTILPERVAVWPTDFRQ